MSRDGDRVSYAGSRSKEGDVVRLHFVGKVQRLRVRCLVGYGGAFCVHHI